jgi:hypothetical protein
MLGVERARSETSSRQIQPVNGDVPIVEREISSTGMSPKSSFPERKTLPVFGSFVSCLDFKFDAQSPFSCYTYGFSAEHQSQ